MIVFMQVWLGMGWKHASVHYPGIFLLISYGITRPLKLEVSSHAQIIPYASPVVLVVKVLFYFSVKHKCEYLILDHM